MVQDDGVEAAGRGSRGGAGDRDGQRRAALRRQREARSPAAPTPLAAPAEAGTADPTVDADGLAIGWARSAAGADGAPDPVGLGPELGWAPSRGGRARTAPRGLDGTPSMRRTAMTAIDRMAATRAVRADRRDWLGGPRGEGAFGSATGPRVPPREMGTEGAPRRPSIRFEVDLESPSGNWFMHMPPARPPYGWPRASTGPFSLRPTATGVPGPDPIGPRRFLGRPDRGVRGIPPSEDLARFERPGHRPPRGGLLGRGPRPGRASGRRQAARRFGDIQAVRVSTFPVAASTRARTPAARPSIVNSREYQNTS